MNKKETIEVLNTLITIHTDRIEGYFIAEKATREFDLKSLFTHLSSTSEKCKEELTEEIIALGSIPVGGSSTDGVFYRVWKYIRKSLLEKDRRNILLSCEFGESLVESAYAKVLKNDSRSLSEEQLQKIRNQKSLLQTDQNYLISFSEVFLQV